MSRNPIWSIGDVDIDVLTNLYTYRTTNALAAQQMHETGDPYFPPWYIEECNGVYVLWKDTDVGRVPFISVTSSSKLKALLRIAQQQFIRPW